MYAPQTRPNRALSASAFTSQDPYRCFINTDKQVYEPGDRVGCKVELTLDRKFVCDEIIATITGEAKVQWSDKQVSGVSLARSQRRTLFKQEKTIWSAQSTTRARSSTTLNDILRYSSSNRIRTSSLLHDENVPTFRGFEAGKHRMPVEFRIPDEEDIHTSIEVDEQLVSVRYQIEIQCFHGRYPKSFVQIIHVIAPRDLNYEFENLSKSARAEKTIEKHGKLTASLTLPKTGLTPGEPLNALVRIDNKTSQSVKYAYIVKQITAISEKPVRDMKTREDETHGSIFPFHKILRGEAREWHAQLHLPSLTPNFCLDGFMQVNHVARLSVGFERGARKSALLHISIPITIGTVAINSSRAEAIPANIVQTSEHSATQASRKVPSLTVPVLPSAPPLYEEEVDGHCPAFAMIDDDDQLPYYTQ